MSSIVRWFLSLLQDNLQIYLKSTQGPIEVYLCPEEVQEPDSPAKEALPSTSTLSPVPDFAEPSCSPDPGIAEAVTSSGRHRAPREGRWAGALLFPVRICGVPSVPSDPTCDHRTSCIPSAVWPSMVSAFGLLVCRLGESR